MLMLSVQFISIELTLLILCLVYFLGPRFVASVASVAPDIPSSSNWGAVPPSSSTQAPVFRVNLAPPIQVEPPIQLEGGTQMPSFDVQAAESFDSAAMMENVGVNDEDDERFNNDLDQTIAEGQKDISQFIDGMDTTGQAKRTLDDANAETKEEGSRPLAGFQRFMKNHNNAG
jgi:hypothetical protein